MADAITPGDWIFDGRPVYIEFQEVFSRDSAGKIIAGTQEIQSRNVYTFTRHRFEPTIHIGGTLPDTQLGEQSSPVGLDAYQGSQEVNAGSINTGETRIYVCENDSYAGEGVGAKWVTRTQSWTMRGEWADYTWPTAP
jgi:hypothetical protein